MDITSKKKIWFADKKNEMYSRISKLQELLTAIANKDTDEVMKIYYRSQHIHTFDEQSIPLKVHIYVEKHRLNFNWLRHIENAIDQISIAAPGIQFINRKESLQDVGSTNYIEIGIDNPRERNSAYTSFVKGYPFIHLGGGWLPENMKGTSTHELLHALGFCHVMERFDSNLYLEVNTDGLEEIWARQYRSNPLYRMMTRFDPFSIMMYPEDEHMKRATGDQIWHLKEGPERSQDLSELDKVALNLMYKPCKSNSKYTYSPKISKITQMFYCGRDVMGCHNQNVPPTLSPICGPTLWANCPSCRVFRDVKDARGKHIRIDKVQRCLGKGKWQGLSGNFYCGKQFTGQFITFRFETCITSDGVCGPDQGIPCTDCGNKLKPGYSYKDFNPIPRNALE